MAPTQCAVPGTKARRGVGIISATGRNRGRSIGETARRSRSRSCRVHEFTYAIWEIEQQVLLQTAELSPNPTPLSSMLPRPWGVEPPQVRGRPAVLSYTPPLPADTTVRPTHDSCL